MRKKCRWHSRRYPGNKTIEIDQDNAKAWNNKGVALSSLGRYRESIQAYGNAIKIDPKHAKAQHNKQLTLRLMANYDALQAQMRAPKIYSLFCAS
jgi:tetratricopeptide (TPR) repeat protein